MNDSMKGDLIFSCFHARAQFTYTYMHKDKWGGGGRDYRILRSAPHPFMTLK